MSCLLHFAKTKKRRFDVDAPKSVVMIQKASLCIMTKKWFRLGSPGMLYSIKRAMSTEEEDRLEHARLQRKLLRAQQGEAPLSQSVEQASARG